MLPGTPVNPGPSHRVWALFLVNLASFLSQIIQIGVIDTLLPLALTNAGLGERHGGMMLSAYWIADLLGGFFVAAILRRTHPAVPLLISGVSSFVLVGVVMYAPASIWVLPAALFAGVGLILRWVVCDGLIVQLAPVEKMGRVVGIHETLMGFGIMAGPLLMARIGDQPMAMTILAGAVGIIALACSPAMPRIHRVAGRDGAQSGMPGMPGMLIGAFGDGLRRWRRYWYLVLIAFVAGFVEICFLSVLPLQAQRDTGIADAGLWLAAVFVLGGTISQPLMGYVSDRGGPVRLAGMCFALLLIGAVPMALAGYGVIAGGIQFVLGLAVAGLYTAAVLIAASGRGAPGGGYEIGVLVLVSQSYTLGAIVGPSVGTALLLGLGNWALPVLVLVCAVVSGVVLMIGRGRIGAGKTAS